MNAVVRDGEQKLASQDTVLREDDRVILEGEPAALDEAVKTAGLELEGDDRETKAEKPDAEIGTLEAVIGPGSLLIGKTAGRLALHERFNVNMIAVSRSGERLTERLRDIRLYAGDVIVLQGPLHAMSDVMRELGCLPLARARDPSRHRAPRPRAHRGAGRGDDSRRPPANYPSASRSSARGSPSSCWGRCPCARRTRRSSGRCS